MYDFEEKPELNITPLVDVMLVLLAILMITTPTLIYEELINLPKGSRSKLIQKTKAIEIKIYRNKKVTVNEKVFNYKNFSDNFMLFSEKMNKNAKVIISADKSLKYGDIVLILRSVKLAGFTKVSLSTNA